MKTILLGILFLVFGVSFVIWGYGLAFSGSSEKVLISLLYVQYYASSFYVGWSWMGIGILAVILAICLLLGRFYKE